MHRNRKKNTPAITKRVGAAVKWMNDELASAEKDVKTNELDIKNAEESVEIAQQDFDALGEKATDKQRADALLLLQTNISSLKELVAKKPSLKKRLEKLQKETPLRKAVALGNFTEQKVLRAFQRFG